MFTNTWVFVKTGGFLYVETKHNLQFFSPELLGDELFELLGDELFENLVDEEIFPGAEGVKEQIFV